MKKTAQFILISLISFLFANNAHAHCEVPCGIYNDQLRVDLIREHIVTIEKAMNSIEELTAEADKNYNQIVRWIQTKEDHANEIQHIVSQYFMTQRVKPVAKSEGEKYEKYIKQITSLHQLLIFAMKSKQTTDLENIDRMRQTLDEFVEAYFEEDHHHHH